MPKPAQPTEKDYDLFTYKDLSMINRNFIARSLFLQSTTTREAFTMFTLFKVDKINDGCLEI